MKTKWSGAHRCTEWLPEIHVVLSCAWECVGLIDYEGEHSSFWRSPKPKNPEAQFREVVGLGWTWYDPVLVPDTLPSQGFVPGGMRHGQNCRLELGEAGAKRLDGNAVLCCFGRLFKVFQRKVTAFDLKDGWVKFPNEIHRNPIHWWCFLRSRRWRLHRERCSASCGSWSLTITAPGWNAFFFPFAFDYWTVSCQLSLKLIFVVSCEHDVITVITSSLCTLNLWTLQGMTSGAVVRDSSQRLEVFIKGSYEKVKDWNEETSPDWSLCESIDGTADVGFEWIWWNCAGNNTLANHDCIKVHCSILLLWLILIDYLVASYTVNVFLPALFQSLALPQTVPPDYDQAWLRQWSLVQQLLFGACGLRSFND